MALPRLMHLIFACSVAFTQADEFEQQRIPLVEIAFSFDTTGSMSSVIARVRQNVAELIGRLQSDIPGIRIAVFAHGDYHDSYVTKHVDFTTDAQALQEFVRNVGPTGGGDSPEAYEKVLREAATVLSWTPGSKRSLVMIGDEIPHEPNYFRGNIEPIDWREEVQKLANMSVKIYSVRALHSSRAEKFYKTMAEETGGFYLRFLTFSYIFDFLMAISYREYGLEFLEAFESEVRSRYEDKGKEFPAELRKLFEALKRQPAPSAKLPNTQQNYTQVYIPPLETPVHRPKPSDMDIYSLHVRTDIAFRFANTRVVSKLANRKPNATEAAFHIELPEAAFITNFTIEMDGKVYVADVKAKETAKKIYQKAKAEGKTAAHVEAQPKHTNSFKVSINVEGEGKVTFTLTYQELLERRVGLYEHVTHIDPGQVVRDLKMEVFIQESREITTLNVPPLRKGFVNRIDVNQANPHVHVKRQTPKSAYIHYNPTLSEQKEISEYGVYGQFVVQYDVKRSSNGGEVQVMDGYFVHFFAPQGLQPLNKNIVFVLDTSGSMSFHKLTQLKRAMLSILEQLRPGDYFSMLSFSSFFRYWKQELLPVGNSTIAEAKEFIKKMIAAGGTNIYKALNKGLDYLGTHTEPLGSSDPSMIFFLTDGQPTDGVTSKTQIINDIRNKNGGNFSIYSLGFGKGVDLKFLQKVSLENGGFARRIYEDAQADLQLKGFYSEISLPLLANISVAYDNNKVDTQSVTISNYNNLFDGSEIVIAGSLANNDISNFISNVNAQGKDGMVNYNVHVDVRDISADLPTIGDLGQFTERLWAYLTIKQMLRKALVTVNKTEKESINNKSLELSLKYHFVTPLTSMVVVKPEDQKDDPESSGDSETLRNAEELKDGKDVKTKKRLSAEYSAESHSDVGLSKSRSRPAYLPARAGRHRGGGGRGGGSSFGDGDPHFVVKIAGSRIPICFDFTGRPGEMYSLLHDPKNEITVNGLWVASARKGGHLKTYIGEIIVVSRETVVFISPSAIRINKRDVKWRRRYHTKHDNVKLTIYKGIHLFVNIGGGIRLHIVRHLHLQIDPLKVDHLGFYVERGSGLSESTDGIIGQFYRRKIHIDMAYKEAVKFQKSAKLTFSKTHQKVKVYPGQRRNRASKTFVKCWAVRNNGRHLLEKSDKAYRVAI